jgi:hypothetical protein
VRVLRFGISEEASFYVEQSLHMYRYPVVNRCYASYSTMVLIASTSSMGGMPVYGKERSVLSDDLFRTITK